jgi:hypothetical protein
MDVNNCEKIQIVIIDPLIKSGRRSPWWRSKRFCNGGGGATETTAGIFSWRACETVDSHYSSALRLFEGGELLPTTTNSPI